MLEHKLNFRIGIDGNAGAGKGTVALALSQYFGVPHIDCGSAFRGFAVGLYNLGIKPQTFNLDLIKDIEVTHVDNNFAFNGVQVGDEIRTVEAGELTSNFANHANGFKPYVLEILTNLASTTEPKVVEGRDVALRVMPKAELLLYFTAPSRTRAIRRLTEKGLPDSHLPEVLSSIMSRDEGDYNNPETPLMRPEKAKIIGAKGNPYHRYLDSGKMEIEEQFQEVLKFVEEKRKELGDNYKPKE